GFDLVEGVDADLRQAEIDEEDQEQERRVADELDIDPGRPVEPWPARDAGIGAEDADHAADREGDDGEHKAEAQGLREDIPVSPDDIPLEVVGEHSAVARSLGARWTWPGRAGPCRAWPVGSAE